MTTMVRCFPQSKPCLGPACAETRSWCTYCGARHPLWWQQKRLCRRLASVQKPHTVLSRERYDVEWRSRRLRRLVLRADDVPELVENTNFEEASKES